MNPLIIEQVFDFFIMFYAGLAVMLCYQILSIYRRHFRPRGLIVLVEELIFWCFAALLTSSFLYYACYGMLSFHAAAAFLAGVAAWKFFVWRKLSDLVA